MPKIVNPRPPRIPLQRMVYSIDEFCELALLSRPAVYNMMKRKQLPFVTIGGRRRIPVENVQKLLGAAK